MEVDNSEALEDPLPCGARPRRESRRGPAGAGRDAQEGAPQRRGSPGIRDLSGTPRSPTRPALSGAGRNDLALGDLESAARRLDQGARDRRARSGALKGRAEIDVARREPRKALERLNRALEIDPFDTEALYSRGRIRAVLGDAAGAKQDLDSFKRYTNDHAELLELRGLLDGKPQRQLAPVQGRRLDARPRPRLGRAGLGQGGAGQRSRPCRNQRASGRLLQHAADEAGLANYYRLRTSSASGRRNDSSTVQEPVRSRAGRRARSSSAGLVQLQGPLGAPASSRARRSRARHGRRELDRSRETAWPASPGAGPAGPRSCFRWAKASWPAVGSSRRLMPGRRFRASSPLAGQAALAAARESCSRPGSFSECRAHPERRSRSTRTQCSSELRHLLLVILVQQGRLERGPQADRGPLERGCDSPGPSGWLCFANTSHSTSRPCPCEGNLEFLGAAGATILG